MILSQFFKTNNLKYTFGENKDCFINIKKLKPVLKWLGQKGEKGRRLSYLRHGGFGIMLFVSC